MRKHLIVCLQKARSYMIRVDKLGVTTGSNNLNEIDNQMSKKLLGFDVS